MILSLREYAEKFAGGVSRMTVARRIEKGLLHSNHLAKKVGNQWVIEVGEFSHLKDYDIQLSRKPKR